METEEKMMTGEESLKIITDMINRTKANVRQSSFHLIFWGWLIFICSIGEYILMKFTGMTSPWYIWYLVAPGVLVSMAYGFSKGRKEHVHSYADMVYMWTWIGFLVVAIILMLILNLEKRYDLIPTFILLAAGLPTFISGIIIKYRPLVIGGLSMWVISLISYFAGGDFSPFAVACAMVTGYLVPGYLIRRRISHDTV
jgi:hypothetical protein